MTLPHSPQRRWVEVLDGVVVSLFGPAVSSTDGLLRARALLLFAAIVVCVSAYLIGHRRHPQDADCARTNDPHYPFHTGMIAGSLRYVKYLFSTPGIPL